MSYTNYMDDCIHLKACRRLQKLVRGKYYGMNIPRHCSVDCSAYQDEEMFFNDSTNNYYTEEQVYGVIHGMQYYHHLPPGDDLIEDFI